VSAHNSVIPQNLPAIVHPSSDDAAQQSHAEAKSRSSESASSVSNKGQTASGSSSLGSVADFFLVLAQQVPKTAYTAESAINRFGIYLSGNPVEMLLLDFTPPSTSTLPVRQESGGGDNPERPPTGGRAGPGDRDTLIGIPLQPSANEDLSEEGEANGLQPAAVDLLFSTD
jgi:hypothetical protein